MVAEMVERREGEEVRCIAMYQALIGSPCLIYRLHRAG